MSNLPDPSSPPPGYLLSDEGHAQLQQIRNQLLLMATLTFAATLKEEIEALLEIRRSSLGQCFENFGSLIHDVLVALTRQREGTPPSSRRH